ncbi:MAG: hypothetical protein QOH79_131 [Acidimicrobiaceae bacterium]
MKFGTVADWVAAVGTGGALVIGMLLLRAELRSRRADSDERLRSQSRHVVCWLHFVETQDDGSWWIVKVRNGSDEPIYQVAVSVDLGEPSGGHPEGWWDVIPPGDEVACMWEPGDFATEPLPWLSFVDAQGAWWHRDGRGVLELERRP